MTSRHATTGWIDRSARARLRLGGADRVKFLHNLTTQDVKGLAPGRGAEAFVTSPQGKTLGYVLLHTLNDAILVRSDEDGLVDAAAHLRKYGVFDEVEIADIGAETFEWHVMPEDAAGWLRERGLPALGDGSLATEVAEIDGERIIMIGEAPAGVAGVTVIGPVSMGETLAERWLEGAQRVGSDSFERLRIRAGTPVFGRDITLANLPQEVDRNDRAISFTKGCYLGQETVARLDALGHVNKVLRGLKFVEGEAPAPGALLLDEDGKAVGTVTSIASGEGEAPAIGLGYIRTNHARAGTLLRLGDGTGQVGVMGLPMTTED